jgi:hypothetical protein
MLNELQLWYGFMRLGLLAQINKPIPQQENCCNSAGINTEIPTITSPVILGHAQSQLQRSDPSAATVGDDTTKDFGCVWDGPNYSCAYDSVFMATFSLYRYANPPWRQRWRGTSNFNQMLAGLFDNILTTMRVPPLRRQLPSLFNTYRDQVRDYLHELDTINFPRCGQVLAAASNIFAWMSRFEGDHHLVHLNYTCNDETHRPRIKRYSATFVLVVYDPPQVERVSVEKPTLHTWLSNYFREMRAVQRRCKTCKEPCSRPSLSVSPLPWIWIDIPPGHDQLFSLSTMLPVEQDSGPNINYILAGIIYVGGQHFSARWRDDSGRWCAYDGMVDSVQPSLDPVTDDAQLTILKNRVMNILIYRLNPMESAIVSSLT